MAIHQEGTPPPPPKPKKQPSLEEGIWLNVRTDKVKAKVNDGVLDVKVEKEDESLYMDENNNFHINLDAGKS